MSALRKHKWTEAEYLAFENASETKHELYRGEIYDIAGASPKHVQITTNTSTTLNLQLRERPCIVYQVDLRLKISRTGNYTYPDIVVICDQPHFTAGNPPALLNPTLIIEVLSPSTEDFDRNEKFQDYIQIDSLRVYVLIAQDYPRVERFTRQNNQWVLSEVTGLETSIELESIQCTLALADVYAKVTFEQDE